MNEQSIFLAAADIADPAQRADYLNRTCAGDPTLRQQVESLLAADERSGEFLDVPVLQQLAPSGGAPSGYPAGPDGDTGAEPREPIGELDLSFLQPATRPGSPGRLGHYEIQEVIGRGGFGIVLRAFDERLHRVVAIKVLAPELARTSPARKRFLREARAAAGIRHENVVGIHAVEEQPIPYLVMEYVASQTLQQKLDESGPLEAREVVRIGQQIASGLEAAHAKGLIHRDIKPGNILLETGKDSIKITDFGLARTADDASVTQSGTIAGTPLYMSPEQALGDTIDPRSDLFSLGSVLYVMCSGRPPFRAANTLAVLKRVAEDQPRPIQEIIPEVPDWLVAIIAKLHAKKPDGRFTSAKEVAVLLGRLFLDLQLHGGVASNRAIPPVPPRPAAPAMEPIPAAHSQCEEKGAHAPVSHTVLPRGRRWAAAVVSLALMAGLSLAEATGVTHVRGTVLRLFSPDGTLVVEVDDPGVSVSIDGQEMVITGTGAKEIRLKPGQYEVRASKDGKLVRQDLVMVTRNGRQVVRVHKEVESPSAPAEAGDPERRAAEWVLSAGGAVRINERVTQSISKTTQLPKEAFRLTAVLLSGEALDSDPGLAHFQDCKHLTLLSISFKKVSDAALANFRNCKSLRVLNLSGTNVSDAALANFKDCKALTILELNDTPVSDAGLAHFESSKNLKQLYLRGTRISDASAACLGRLDRLIHLRLEGTRVSPATLEALKKSLPNCRIEWGGGVSRN